MSETSLTQNQGDYVQLFVYRVPKRNHDAMFRLEKKLATLFRKHGMLASEFYQVTSSELFKDFTSLGELVRARPDDEIWVELEHYRDPDHMKAVVASIGKDSDARPLFGQVYGPSGVAIATIMGDLRKVAL